MCVRQARTRARTHARRDDAAVSQCYESGLVQGGSGAQLVRIDMRIGTCMDMYIGMCIGMRHLAHVCARRFQHVCRHACQNAYRHVCSYVHVHACRGGAAMALNACV